MCLTVCKYLPEVPRIVSRSNNFPNTVWYFDTGHNCVRIRNTSHTLADECRQYYDNFITIVTRKLVGFQGAQQWTGTPGTSVFYTCGDDNRRLILNVRCKRSQ